MVARWLEARLCGGEMTIILKFGEAHRTVNFNTSNIDINAVTVLVKRVWVIKIPEPFPHKKMPSK